MSVIGQLVIIDGNKEPFEYNIAYGEKGVLIGSDVRCQIKIQEAIPFHARISVDSKENIWLTSYARDDPVLLSGLIPLPFNVPVRLNHTDEFEVVKAKFLLELADVAGDHPFSAFVPVSPIKKPAEEEKKKKKKEEAQPENKEEEEKKTPSRKRSLFSSTENESAARKRPRRASASASSASSVASVASVAEGVEDGEAAATIAPDVSVGDEWKCDKCKFKTSAANISWINRHQNLHSPVFRC